jgi:subtilisin family serine protease
MSSGLAAQDPPKFARALLGPVEGEYIVILNAPKTATAEAVAVLAADVAAAHEIAVEEVWSDAVKAFFVRMSEERAMAVSTDERVTLVEQNAEWYLSSEMQTNINPATCDPTAGTCPPVLDNRLWHLDRVDSNVATPSLTRTYCTDGANVTVYVVDTGVNKFHQEFAPGGSQVKAGFNASLDGMPADDPCMGFAIPPGENAVEQSNYTLELGQSGHGTAVASVLGGKRIGVAKNVSIVPVKIARCDRFSARVWKANTTYQTAETIFAPIGTKYYRAVHGGTSGATEPSAWPTTTSTFVDGGVEWQYVSNTDPPFSTDKLARGLNWILSAQNTQGPRQYAVVTLSTYVRATDVLVGTIETAIQSLLAAKITVVASANNQNGNACDTSPARMSINNPTASVASDVITAGGSMVVNRPWGMDISDVTVPEAYEADGVRNNTALGPYGVEPFYDSALPVKEARWVCGAGDSAVCFNDGPTSTVGPTTGSYLSYNAGSNGGPCVTLFAPAKNIFVAGVVGPNDYRDARLRGVADRYGNFRGMASGTSFSAPIVAGVAARILQANPTFTPAQVRGRLLANSVSTLDPSTLDPYDHNGVQITGTPNVVLRDGDLNITTQPQSTPAAVSGPTSLSVAAASLTSNAFTYQWYEVNSGFDYATYKSGAFSSSQLVGATGSTYQAPASATTEAYWVRVSNGCSTADSQIAVVVPRPQGAPSNVVATASAENVTVTWSMGTGAERYEVQRMVAAQPWTRAGLVPSGVFTFNEVPPAPGGMVVYRVLAVAGEAYLPTTNLASSPPSNSDFANLNETMYETIAMPADGSTTVKAQHLIELREAVNALCDTIGAPHQYVASQVLVSSLQGTTVKAADFTGLMAKINFVRTNALLAAGSAAFAHVPVTTSLIKGEHLESLRAALR